MAALFAAAGKGVVRPWMTGATDLLGKPRLVGMSLLVSTFKALFEGCREFEFKLSAVAERHALPCDGRARTPSAPSLAEQALQQIKAKGYHEKYLRQGKKVTLIGAAFDAEMRNLTDRAIEEAEG